MPSESSSELELRYEMARRLAAAGLLETFTHQAKNDIFAMTGLAELALAAPNLPEDARRYIEVVMQSGRSLQEASRLLLDYARDEDDEQDTATIEDAAEHACQIARSVSLLRHVELEEQIANSRTPVVAARNHLVTMALLLLCDAVNRVEHGSKIVMSGGQLDGSGHFLVTWERPIDRPHHFELDAAAELARSYGGQLQSESHQSLLHLPLHRS